MIVYLSLKQIILNQIAVLIRKQSDKSNDDPERLLRRLNYLQQALEQIKSYQHNSNFQYVIKHFNIELSESEQEEMRQLSHLFDDSKFQSAHNKNKGNEKSGFTTQRSETLFTGAAEEQYGNFYGSDNDIDDEKTPRNNAALSAPQWIHYKGFAHWLKKQSFIKFKKRNDIEKYRKIWNTVLGLNLINQWDKGKIKPMNIIGRYGTIQPYIAVHKCGSKEIVKASLLRLSITQNRIFKFNVDTANMDTTAATKSRARRSIDMDVDNENEDEYNGGYTLSANELIQGRNLFDLVSNKDVLRIVATMLWDTNLANNVLEELLHNPRFSMYGIHADKIADTIAKEMRLNYSYDNEETPVTPPNNMNVNATATESVEQFALPSPQRAVSLQKQKEINQNVNYSKGPSVAGGGGGQVYSPQFEDNNDNNDNSYKPNNAPNAFSFQRPNTNNDNNKKNTKKTASDHARYEQQKYMQSVPEQEPTPSPDPHDSADANEHKPHHKAHSASVVFHDNIRDSEINDYGAHNNEYDSHDAYGDDDESVSNSAEMPQHPETNANIGFGRQQESTFDDASSPSNNSQNSVESFLMTNKNALPSNEDKRPSTDLTMFDKNISTEFTAAGLYENADTKDEEMKAGLKRKKSVLERTSFLKRDFTNMKETQQWNKVTKHLNVIFNSTVSSALKEYAIEEEFDFQAILDDIEDYPQEPDDSNIMEYMQQEFSWNKRECDKFFRTLKRILMDRKASRRTSSLVQILGFNLTDSSRDPNANQLQSGDMDKSENESTSSNKMYINDFNEKWSDGVVQKLQKYCVEEEYDIEAIAEDLETFEEENSMIVDEIAKQYDWDDHTSKVFVDDLRRLISTDPQQAKIQLSLVEDEYESD